MPHVDAPPRRYFWLSVLLVVWATMAVPLCFPGYRVGTLLDTDPYLRLARVVELREHGHWFESRFPRDNAPFGNDLHWTRPLDVVLLLLGLALEPFVGFKTGLLWLSHLVNPLCLLAAAWILERGLRGRFDEPRRLLVVALLIIQPMVFAYCSAPRVDHHAAQVLLLCATLAGLIGYGYADDVAQRSGHLRRIALACGMAVWISFESLSVLLLAIGSLWSFWVFGRRDFRREQWRFLAWLGCVVAVALLIERGRGAFTAWQIDRLSAMHLVLLLAIALTGGLLRLLPAGRDDRPARRALLLIGAALVAGVLVFSIFPSVLSAPLRLVDPRIDAIFHGDVVEIHSIYHAGRLDWNVAENLIFVPLVIVFLLRRFRRDGADPLWLTVAVGVALWTPLALYQQRHALFAQVVLVLPLASLLGSALLAAGLVRGLLARVALRSLILIVAMAAPVALSAVRAVFDLVGSAAPRRGGGQPAGRAVDLGMRLAMMRFLADPGGLGARPLVVMAEINLSTMLMFETPHATIASPYHRNVDGVVDANAFFVATDDRVPLVIAQRRGVDLVLIERPRRSTPPPDDGAEPFGTRLLCGRGPAWIEPIELPQALCRHYSLFAVQAR